MDDLVDILAETDRRDNNRAWQSEPEVWERGGRDSVDKEVLVDPPDRFGKMIMS